MLIKIIVVLVAILAWVIFILVRFVDTDNNAAEDREFKKSYPGPCFYLDNGKVYFDKNNRRLLFATKDGNYYHNMNSGNMFNVQSIERLNEESRNGHPISRAVVGGLLAGGAGAIVGAVSGAGNKSRVYLRRLEYLFNIRMEDESIETIRLIVASCVSDPDEIRRSYSAFDSIGELLRLNIGVDIQHVD